MTCWNTNFTRRGEKTNIKRRRFKHYSKMWFLWLGQFATIASNKHVVINGFKSQHFDNYSYNCEYVIVNMTKHIYDYIYDYMSNVIILK